MNLALATWSCAWALASGPAPAPHPGPPIWADVTIDDGGVLFALRGEPEPLARMLGLDDDLVGPLEPAVALRARAAIEELVAGAGVRAVDGAAVAPVFERVEFPVDDAETDGWLRVEVDVRYPTDGPPRNVRFLWRRWEGAIWLGETYVPLLVKQGRHLDMVSLYPAEPEFLWHARERTAPGPRPVPPPPPEPTTLPAASLASALVALAALGLGAARRLPRGVAGTLALLGAAGVPLLWDVGRVPLGGRPGLPSDAQALAIFEQLHANVYASFDAGSEDAIYELLADSVAPELLDELYGDVYESLILRDQGGAVCSIEQVEVLDRAVDFHRFDGAQGPPRFAVDWRWRVHGLVAHWGHVHRRRNEYDATYVVRHDGRSWKIAGVDVHAHQRIDDDG